MLFYLKIMKKSLAPQVDFYMIRLKKGGGYFI